jgi:hypothetical protein
MNFTGDSSGIGHGDSPVALRACSLLLVLFASRFSFSVFWAGFFAMLFFEFLSFVAMITSSR